MPLAFHPPFRLWAARTWALIDSVELPVDMPRVHAGGPNPDRILLFGSDILVGRGVLSHEVSFAGFLARAISQATGRGTDVIVSARSHLTVAEAVVAARSLELDRYDAVVVDLGLADAMGGTSSREWAEQLELLLHILSAGSTSSARVFFIESPDPTDIPLFRSKHGRTLARAFSRFNEASQNVIRGFTKVSYLPFPMEHDAPADRLNTARTFSSFAATFAPALIEHLDEEFMAGAARPDPVVSEDRRQASLDRLNIVGTAPEPRFDQIVARAQRLFSTEFAAFNLIDRDRRWSKSHIGPHGSEIAPDGVRSQEFCNVTLHAHGGLVIGDLRQDSRFRDHPGVTGEPRVRFYAGYPIEAPDGQRIGTLCVYGTKPRALNGLEEAMLRELATKVERELWDAAEHTDALLSVVS